MDTYEEVEEKGEEFITSALDTKVNQKSKVNLSAEALQSMHCGT
jgi:hypothetical protein